MTRAMNRADQSATSPDCGTPTRGIVFRGLLVGVLALGTLFSSVTPVAAKDPVRGIPEGQQARKARRKAIRAGCKFLVGKQRPDGGFGHNKATVALTALSVLALMADGSSDGRGPYGKEVRRGIDFLIKLIETKEPDSRWHEGYFEYPHDTTSRMHGQGYATLTLATALGTASSERYKRIRRVLKKAVACCEAAQTTTGGWGYKPLRNAEHEGSVTVTVAQGLRAARDAGLVVDENVVRDGLNYLRKSQKKEDGSFKYSLRQEQSTYALTAAALSAFFLFGVYEDPRQNLVNRAIDYMRLALENRGIRQPWYYYGHFYAAWACWQHSGNTWDRKKLWGWWQSKVYPDLLARQTSDGSWEEETGRYNFGPVMTTAFAVLTLAIPDEVIPIFQR